jgi:excisionase family DNA binding protein
MTRIYRKRPEQIPTPTDTATEEKQFLTTNEAAAVLGVHHLTLYRWRREGKGPPYIRFMRTVRYDRSKLHMETTT